MIILCSDYVGFEVIKFLIDSNEHISYLVLDNSDKNNFNSKIIDYYKRKFPDNPIYFEDILNDEKFLLDLKKQNIEFGILAWWPHILKGKVTELRNSTSNRFVWMPFGELSCTEIYMEEKYQY